MYKSRALTPCSHLFQHFSHSSKHQIPSFFRYHGIEHQRQYHRLLPEYIAQEPTHTQMDSCLQIARLKGIPAADEGSNFVFSPLSIRAALSLTAAGAKGETLRQLLSFLGSPPFIDHLHSASARLVEAVREGDSELLLSFVNGLWIDRSVTVNSSFMGIAASIYHAAAESADFKHEAPLEQKKINDWIEQKTNGIIKNLIPDGTVDNETRLILANALHFKGKWQEKFDPYMTRSNYFYLLDGSTIQVPFMSSRKDQFISSYHGFKVLKLPYKQQENNQGNRSFSLLLFLPDEINGLEDLINRAVYDPNFINRHVPCRRVKVQPFMVPKFKISFSCETTDVLSNLGLKSLFSWPAADLSGMCLESARLYVSSIRHKAAIEVDEEGTVAEAATAVTMRFVCNIKPVSFVADHPFMFVLREDVTGAILFFGHVANPSVLG
ncbi:serpin-ZXA [Dendrobium catenatum]|uniref:serpin-ZXA n=1 Tax=Dendrobium catenatum TaxID=906689 RepID=UPI0009F5C6F0|nr:serpin-ZXA [Dendrobium catenatum]